MRRPVHLFTLHVCLFLFFAHIAKAQQVVPTIQGPSVVCLGECATYFVQDLSPNCPDVGFWYLDNGTAVGLPGGTNYSATICWDSLIDFQVGTYLLFAQFDCPDSIPFLTVEVVDFFQPEILSLTNSACAQDSLIDSDCQQVCAFSTVTYSVNTSSNPTGSGVFWTFSGAESYEVDGNFLTITWGAAGSGFVSVFVEGGLCPGENTICVEILEDPVADFTTQPPADAGVVTICEGQSVFFENLSQGADQYGWFFDVLGISTQTDPEFAFQTPGTYEVSLVARNECGCSDTTSLTILVEAAETPIIDCTGGVCAGETVTYTTSANCTSFGWNVTGNGQVVGGGGPADNYITIEWLDGPYGFIELDVSACSGNYCTSTLVERIPVMTAGVTIEGAQKVCRDETELYRLPEFDGSAYVWSVSSQGQILSGQGTNEILVQWSGPLTNGLTEWVQVEYDNCFLDCSGSSQLPVGVLNEFYVSGPIVVCEGETANYTAQNVDNPGGTDWDWAVQTPDGAVLWTSAAAAPAQAIDWTFGPGKYVVVATATNPGLYCGESYEVFVDVKAAPAGVSAINGPALICPGTPFVYSVGSAPPNGIYHWTIHDGGAVVSEEGTSIVVTWGPSPPYELEVTQTSVGGPACSSLPVSLTVEALGSLAVTGPSESCVESTAVYSTDDIGLSDFQWTINPAGAGTILSGASTSSIEVLWHVQTTATVSVSVCGETASANVSVLASPAPDPLFPASLCQGSTALVNTGTSFATYEWLDANGNLLTTDPMPQLGPGTFELIVTDVAGCEGNTSFTIQEDAVPEVYVSTPDPTNYCAGDPPATLYATTMGSGYSYQWFFEGNPIGGNASSHTAGNFGGYWVEATDVNGCVAISNTVEIVEYCPPGGGPIGGGGGGSGPPPSDCDPGTSVVFQVLPSGPNCSEASFEEMAPDLLPGTLSWSFGDGTTSNDQGPVVSHVYSQAGFYNVRLTGTAASTGDLCWDEHVVTIPAAAYFSAAPACAGQVLQFEDRSTFVPTTSIVAWDWDFGDGNSSGASDPAHTYSAPGSYDVTLTITAQSGCQSGITRTVEVYAPPVVAFDLPSVSCEGTPLPFEADVPANVIGVAWDFGDPASGSANGSTGFSTFHDFSGPGNYDVKLIATSVYGCLDSLTQTMAISGNALGGDVATLPDPPQVCEGEAVVLTAPVGGVSWVWSDGQSAGTISVLEEALYTVTVTDAQGCQHVAGPVSVDIVPGPNAVISAVEYNEYGQPVGIFYNAYTVCEGEGVYLQVEGAPGYTYTWSNGETGTSVIFADWRNNPLPVGTHPITVEVIDPVSGCESIIGPFVVTVNALPDNFLVTAFADPPCAGQPTTLSVVNPEPGLSYVWTTGETGTSIEVVLPGIYNAAAVNSSGCRRDSDTPVTVEPGPYLGAIPSGCHTQCNPDTICLPELPNVVSYQWYFNGAPVPGPEGTMPNLPVTQSGSYYVDMIDDLGCQATSDPLQLDLYDGFGTILGNVYMDINQNGVIDGPDTLVVGIGVELWENGVQEDNTASGAGGAYSFPNILATSYTVQLDTSSFPEGVTYALSWQEPAGLVGCDDEAVLDWLLSPSCETFDTLILIACEGDSADYNGDLYPGGFVGDFIYSNAAGCDSTVTVIVEEIPAIQGAVTLIGCEGEVVYFDSIPLPSPSFFLFEYTDQYGCDSIIAVTVLHEKVDTTNIVLISCEGEDVEYDSMLLSPGTVLVDTFTNYLGCDSLVRVIVELYDSNQDSLFYSSCNGVPVPVDTFLVYPGTDTTLTYTSIDGCDSLVFISVADLGSDTTEVLLHVCQGDSIIYNGDPLPPGGPYPFHFTSFAGCDSLVLVTVGEWPVHHDTLYFDSCEGVPVIVGDSLVYPGTQVTLFYQNLFGCDSLVTAVVDALPVSNTTVNLGACQGEVVDYFGNQIPAGETAVFVLSNEFACDSVVTVIVEEWPVWASDQTLHACVGELVPFGDTLLLAGTQTPVTLPSFQGCDSVVTVTVLAFSADTTELFFEVCPGETMVYWGKEYGAGQHDSLWLPNANGCDSLVRIWVTGLPTFDWEAVSDLSCWDIPTGGISVSVAQGVEPFIFRLDDEEGGPLFQGLEAGTYSLEITDGNGCRQVGAISVGEIPPLEPEVAVEPWDCKSGRAGVNATFTSGQGSIIWPDGSTGTFWNAPAPGPYTVVFENECETLTQAFEVVLAEDDSNDPLFLPNIFSPNYDGINDIFRAFPAEGVQVLEYRLLVFDRWGNMLFETQELDSGWDGRFDTEELDPGLYVYYVISRVVSCGVEKDFFKEGGITLVR